MASARTLTSSAPGGCAHAYRRSIGPYEKCTACGLVMVK